MFNKLPDLFDRNFAIGYALPAALFLSASLLFLNALGLQDVVTSYATLDTLLGTTLIVLLSLLIAVLLLVVNRDVYRVLEGYTFQTLKPVRRLTERQRTRFEALKNDVERLKKQRRAYRERGVVFPVELADELRTKQEHLVLHFPHEEAFLLPTSFGNTIRAFEVYPTVMYGIDSIHGWNRLLAVVPKEYVALVDSAKAATDFWVNLICLGLVFIAGTLGLLVYTGQWMLAWVPVFTLMMVIIGYKRATSAAVEWGDMFKAAFDVFLPDLATKLHFDQPHSEEATQRLWGSFSQAIVFRVASAFPTRTSSSLVSTSDPHPPASDTISSLAQSNQIRGQGSSNDALADGEAPRPDLSPASSESMHKRSEETM